MDSSKSKPAEWFELIGKTIISIEGVQEGSEKITLTTTDKYTYTLEHIADCCESVQVFETHGDKNTIIGHKITFACEERVSEDDTPVWLQRVKEALFGGDSITIERFVLACDNGRFEIIIKGESNGYYGETMYFNKVKTTQ